MKPTALLLLFLSLNAFSSEQSDTIPEKTDQNGYVEPLKCLTIYTTWVISGFHLILSLLRGACSD